jgi:4-hydroxybenzoate polyprenyltransferase
MKSTTLTHPRSPAPATAAGPARRTLGLLGLWRLADPKISLASFAALFLGAAAAATLGPLDWTWLVVTVLAVFAIEVAKNASGEVVDFDTGTDLAVAERDRSPFSGGKRVLVDGLLTRGQTVGIAAAGYGIAIALGLAIALGREPRVLGLGVVGLVLAYGYHAPPPVGHRRRSRQPPDGGSLGLKPIQQRASSSHRRPAVPWGGHQGF